MTEANPSILAVVVLYQMEASRSPTMVSFCRALDESGLANQFRLLIYDNSPSRQAAPDSLPVAIQYLHDPANGGVAAAYNAALQMAEKDGVEWLLLLDQDTEISADYLKTLWRSLLETAAERRFAAWVPKLLSKNKIISPARVLWGGRLPPVDKTLCGIAPWEVVVLNSGALLRVSALRAIGGFNLDFWLDFLDHWLFSQLQRAGYRVYVLDTTLPHDLSLTDMGSVPVDRYRNILSAEGQFYQCCKSPTENLLYGFRLLARAAKRLVTPSSRHLFLPTLAHLARLLRQNHSAASAEKQDFRDLT